MSNENRVSVNSVSVALYVHVLIFSQIKLLFLQGLMETVAPRATTDTSLSEKQKNTTVKGTEK